MTITLWDPIIIAIVARLNSDLNGIIDAVNASQTNPTFPIQYPQAILDYIPTVAELSALPCIGVSDGNIKWEDDTGLGATAHAQFSIVAFVQSQDQRELAWMLRRYAIAMTRCLIAGRSLPPEGWGVVVDGITPGPTLGRDESPRQWLSTVGVRIAVRWEQDS